MYTVKILPSEEFDKLPFKRAKEALGAADAKTGIAYIRDTGYNDVTKTVIAHELDELMAKTSPHEEDGIRYFLGFLGPIFSGLFKAAATGAKFLGSTALKGAQSVGNFLTPGPAMFGPAAKGAGALAPLGASGYNPAAAAASVSGKPLSSLANSGYNPSAAASAGGGNIFSAFSKSAGNALAPLSMSGYNPAAAASANPLEMFSPKNFPISTTLKSAPKADFFSQAMSGIKNLITQQPEGDEDNSILGQFKKAAPGAAISMLGNLFAKDVAAPDFSSVTDPLRSRIEGQEGLTGPAFDLGFGEAKRTIDAPLGEVPEEVFGQSEKLRNQQLTDDLTQLRNQFKALNPTADVDNNSAYLREKSRLEERAREDKANSRAAVSYDYTNQEMQRRLSTMQTLLNLDQAQTTQLIQLAQLDAYEIMAKTGIELEEANQIKQLFGSFGEAVMQSQFPSNAAKNAGTIINIGGA